MDSSATTCEYILNDSKMVAKMKLDSWNPLPLNDEKVVKWVRQVLGYFRNCYKNRDMNEPDCWMEWVEDHAGVRLIRKYYPEYNPSQEDFDMAKWGT